MDWRALPPMKERLALEETLRSHIRWVGDEKPMRQTLSLTSRRTHRISPETHTFDWCTEEKTLQ